MVVCTLFSPVEDCLRQVLAKPVSFDCLESLGAEVVEREVELDL